MKFTGTVSAKAIQWSFGVAALLSAATGANAACENWNFAGGFNAIQENGFSVVFEVGETHKLHAYGIAYYHTDPNFDQVTGTASLEVAADDPSLFRIMVFWPDGKAGEYRGRVDIKGKITGHTIEFQDGRPVGSTYLWYSKIKAKCSSPNKTGIETPDAPGIPASKATKQGMDQPEAIPLPQ